jgi:hypothetical protein
MCKKCGVEKDISEFFTNQEAGHRTHYHCKACHLADGRERAKRLRAEHPEKIRDAKLKAMYGISLETYNQMLEAQHGVCLICGEDNNRVNYKTGKPENFAVDHDHATGKVRGLLCHRCNIAVGLFEEFSTHISAYLAKSKK